MTAQDLDADTFTRCYGGLCKRLQRLSRTGANNPPRSPRNSYVEMLDLRFQCYFVRGCVPWKRIERMILPSVICCANAISLPLPWSQSFNMLDRRFVDSTEDHEKRLLSMLKDQLKSYEVLLSFQTKNQGTIGCTPNRVPMVLIVFSRDSWGL